jgi:hypothetical protein
VEKAVFGIAQSEDLAVRIVDALKASGFSNNDIFKEGRNGDGQR